MDIFEIYLIKPTRYCDEGYPLQWFRTWMPSNSLASVNGLVMDSLTRLDFAKEGGVKVYTIDETNTDVKPQKIIKHLKKTGRRAFFCMIGVQSNQFPRAVDLSKDFLDAGHSVCIGGFHVSGCLSMLKEMPADLVAAQEMGISFFAGEAEEGRMDGVLQDAYDGQLKPLYNYINQTPDMANAPMPILPPDAIKGTANKLSSFDLGRGCPFECSFCTIINVQGRKSRFRTADDLEKIVRENAAQGIDRFFLTDDNFARNKNWKAYTDRLIELKKEGLSIHLNIQVDTLAHKIPGFIEACIGAGAAQVFIGLENINADNLEAANKRQNRIEDYREMFLAWKKHPVFIMCGYIIGFPGDTKESILKDIETVKKYLPTDAIYLNYLTPLPGSMDHKVMYEAGTWMDPDMNKYDLNHRVTKHPKMTDQEWEEAYDEAMASFYSWEHMETILKRMVALGSNKRIVTVQGLTLSREGPQTERESIMESGIFRIYRRTQRRKGYKIESPLTFYPRYFLRSLGRTSKWFVTFWKLYRMVKRIEADPKSKDYWDEAIALDTNIMDEALMKETRMSDYAKKRMKRKKDTEEKLAS